MTIHKWEKPPDGTMNLNFDVEVDSSLKKIGVGIVIRDAFRQVVVALAKVLPCIHDCCEFKRVLKSAQIVCNIVCASAKLNPQ
jgi:hypothetical protein